MLQPTTTLQPNQRGAAVLLTVVIVSVAALLMAVGAVRLGLGELDIGYTAGKGGEAFSAADGCVENGLRRLRTNSSYTGENLILSNGSCTITVTGATSTREISATGVVGAYNKKIVVDLTLNGDVIAINSWMEAAP